MNLLKPLSLALIALLVFSAPAEARKKKKNTKPAPEQATAVVAPSFPKDEAKLWEYIQNKVKEKNFYALMAAEQYKQMYPNSKRLHDLAIQMRDFAFQGMHYNSYKAWLEYSEQQDPLFWIRTGEWEGLADHQLTPHGTQLHYAIELFGQTDSFLQKRKGISESPWYWAIYLSDKKNLDPSESERNDILDHVQVPQNDAEKDDWAEVIIKLALVKTKEGSTSSALRNYEKRRQELQKVIEYGTPEAGLYALAAIIQLQADLKAKYESLAPNPSTSQQAELTKLNTLIEENKKECELYTKKNLVNVEAVKICERELTPQDIFEERVPTAIKVPTTSRVGFLSSNQNKNEIVKTMMKYLDEGNPGWVWHYLENQTKIYPQDPWWLAQLGMFYLYINKWREAETLFAKATAIERFQPAAWQGRAFANYRFGHDQQARVAWMRSQKQKPNVTIDMPARLNDLEKYKKKKKRYRAKGKATKKAKK